ncbi:tRNA lysidine(34) synthetase TilS, partial [bacterium]|nr:tRNA lysidine(34) synthetase TilS [bacterium]
MLDPHVKQCRMRLKDAVLALAGPMQGQTLLLAVSGGVDSMVMLDAFAGIADWLGMKIVAGHIHHGLRGEEADADARLVETFSQKMQVSFILTQFEESDVQLIKAGNVEEGARNLRYEKLVQIAKENYCDGIATAHTKSDQAETVLHRLMRSTGPAGLCGIWPVRRDEEVPILRPMLIFTREEIFQYARAAAVPFRQDSMNIDPHYTRVRIRQSLLPDIKEHFNPNVEDALAHLADVVQEEEVFWDSHMNALIKRIGEAEQHAPADRQAFLALTRAEQRRLLRAYGRKFDMALTFEQVQEAIHLLKGHAAQAEMHFAEHTRLYLRHNGFFLSAPIHVPSFPAHPLPIPGFVSIPELGIRVKAERVDSSSISERGENRIYVDGDKLPATLTIRPRREGDRIAPPGLGGSKKIKKILQEQKVPCEERERIPLICA